METPASADSLAKKNIFLLLKSIPFKEILS